MDYRCSAAIAVSLALLSNAANCAEIEEQQAIEEIRVTASRTHSELVSSPRQTTVLDVDEIELRRLAGGTIAELLSAAVPGLAPPSQTPSEFSLTLRGRNFLTLIDGVPMDPSRNVNRNLTNLHPSQIERVEVIRGSNAIYGSGASGGIVSITTRQPTAAHAKASYAVVTSSLTDIDSDGYGYEIGQTLTGTFDTFDYALNVVYGQSGANFDADGVRIAPEVSQGDIFESETLGALAKIGRDFGASQRVQLSLNTFDKEQDTDYGSDTSVLQEPLRSVDARAIRGLQLDKQNEFENLLVNLDYYNDDAMKGTLHAQLYHRNHETRFYPFDARALPTWRHLVQTFLKNEVVGGRVTFNTPMALFSEGDSELIWGADLNKDESEAPVTTYDGDAFDDSGGLAFIDTGDKVHMPPTTTRTTAGFAQLRTRISETWSWDVGARFQSTEVEFDDFITLPQTLGPDPVVTRGGSIEYDEWVFNAALVLAASEAQHLYAAFNQGVEQPDIGLQVRNAQPGFDIKGSSLRAIETNSYELGWRGDWDSLSSSLALFYNTSDLGGVSTEDFGLTLSRTEERIRGVEADLDYTFNSRWAGGISFSYLEGEEKSQGATAFSDMNGFRIPPFQMDAYLRFDPTPQWHNRLELFYVDDEDYRLDGMESFGRRTTSSYWTVKFMGRYEFETAGSLHVAVENLFNNDYRTLFGQLLRSSSNQSHIPARGATLRVGYTYDW